MNPQRMYNIKIKDQFEDETTTKKLVKYHFPAEDEDWCTEKCIVREGGIMVGSVSCQKCRYCTSFGNDLGFSTDRVVDWITCEKQGEAFKLP